MVELAAGVEWAGRVVQRDMWDPLGAPVCGAGRSFAGGAAASTECGLGRLKKRTNLSKGGRCAHKAVQESEGVEGVGADVVRGGGGEA